MSLPGSKKRGRKAPDLPRAEEAIRLFLDALGLDTGADALASTPRTVARAFGDRLLSGYRTTPEEALGAGFPVQSRGPVVALGVPVMFVCPHHLLPAEGTVHVAFLPHDRVPGLARIARLIDALAHRLVLQEDLTLEIARAFVELIDAHAAVAIIEARHACVAVEDFARRDTVFRTRAAVGPEPAIASLDREIDANLRSEWATSASKPPSKQGGSKSPSPRRASSAAPRKPRTASPRPRRSRSDGS